jgi:hypothetical protein
MQEVAMLMLLVKSKLAQLSARVADQVLGPLSRATRLTADADMCLLLRIEVPRHAYRNNRARPELKQSVRVS